MNSQPSRRKKIFIFTLPAHGHINPMSCLVHELCMAINSEPIEVIFYGNEEHRELIEKTGATFRQYAHSTFATLSSPPPITTAQKQRRQETSSFFLIFNLYLHFAERLLPQMIRDTETQRPDLIVYDSVFMPVKYMLEILRRRGTYEPPRCVRFIPNFAINASIMNLLIKSMRYDWTVLIEFVILFFKQLLLSWRLSINVYNPINLYLKPEKSLNIVAVFPELQPRREEFDASFKFVGPCISEVQRSFEIKNDEKLSSLLELCKHQSDLKLVYMSLGTLFNYNMFIFEAVIEAIRRFDSKPGRKLKLAQLKFVFSVGQAGLSLFREKRVTTGDEIPDNVLLCDNVPQLEVLKRADLFISHAGMNSTSEAIKYGVPMICIPLNGDQPLVASRVCDELELGRRLDPMRLSVDEIGDAMDEVIGDAKYRDRVGEVAKVSAKYNGVAVGARLIIDLLNDELELLERKKSN
jgi:UDP:flavonoid glycosyltransferase YjiC (YdhE family)